MSEEAPPTPKRILVALNASPHSQAALDAAVRLAVDLEAEIEGLFVKDETLIQAAQLPFAKEVRSYTAPPKRLDDERIRRQLRYQAKYAEHSLQRAAERVEVTYSFRATTGNVTNELLRATTEVDLLVIGKTSTRSSRRRLGTTSQTVLSEGSSSVLVLRESIPPQRPFLVYYDGSEAAKSALHLAVELSRRTGSRPVTVILPPQEEGETDRLRDEVQDEYAHSDVPMDIYPLTRVESYRLSAFVRREDGLVLLPAGATPLTNVPLQKFLYEIDRPLLVVR